MTGPSPVVCVIPTRGDVDMQPVLDSIPVPTVVWNNALADHDYTVYGRYLAILLTTASLIVTQDDDVILPATSWEALLDAYTPGKVVCNVPARFRERYTDSGLVGFGAVFDRELVGHAFRTFRTAGGVMTSPWFRRTCDLVFTMFTPMLMVDLPYEERECAHAENRMWKQPDHREERNEMRKFCRRALAGVA